MRHIFQNHQAEGKEKEYAKQRKDVHIREDVQLIKGNKHLKYFDRN